MEVHFQDRFGISRALLRLNVRKDLDLGSKFGMADDYGSTEFAIFLDMENMVSTMSLSLK